MHFVSEQNCLDIARAYADFRIVDLVQAKIDTLPKLKENKKGKGGKPQPKPRPATAQEKVQEFFMLLVCPNNMWTVSLYFLSD